MKEITILSGKGGVGKSSVAASLAILFAKKKNVVAVDCDVDASNLGLVLGVKKLENQKHISTNYKAHLNKSQCKGSKKCLDICTFSAIEWDEKNNIPKINKFLCEGCGACQLICPNNAFNLVKVKNAIAGRKRTKYGFPLVSGQLKMGESGSGNVVDVIKDMAHQIKADMMIVDSAAGIGCPVIASIRGSDFVVAITEPSPSALSDMKRALTVVDHFRVPYGIIINKFDLNRVFSKKIEQFARKNKIPILGKIPYNKIFVKALVEMKPVITLDKKIEKTFIKIKNQIEAEMI